jgi:hypothetical protein
MRNEYASGRAGCSFNWKGGPCYSPFSSFSLAASAHSSDWPRSRPADSKPQRRHDRRHGGAESNRADERDSRDVAQSIHSTASVVPASSSTRANRAGATSATSPCDTTRIREGGSPTKFTFLAGWNSKRLRRTLSQPPSANSKRPQEGTRSNRKVIHTGWRTTAWWGEARGGTIGRLRNSVSGLIEPRPELVVLGRAVDVCFAGRLDDGERARSDQLIAKRSRLHPPPAGEVNDPGTGVLLDLADNDLVTGVVGGRARVLQPIGR